MAVAFMMFIKELRRNGGETAATAENRRFFLPFLAELVNSETFETNLFFLKKYFRVLKTKTNFTL